MNQYGVMQPYQSPEEVQQFHETQGRGEYYNPSLQFAMVNPMIQQINVDITCAPPVNSVAMYQDLLCLDSTCRSQAATIARLQDQLQQQRQQVSCELPDYLTNDIATGTLRIMRRNSSVVSPFAYGTIELIGLLVFEEPYCLENRYKFCVKSITGNIAHVEIPFSEMNPKKLIERFSVNGGLAFLGNMSDVRKGELLRAFIVPATGSIKMFFVPYFPGWQIDEEKNTMIYRYVTDVERNMMRQCNQLSRLPPLWESTRGRRESLDTLMNLTDIFTDPMPAAVLIAWSHYGRLYSILESLGFTIPMPLYVIGQERTITTLLISVMEVLGHSDSGCISILEKKGEIEHRLYCAKDENIVVDDAASTVTKTTQQKRLERLQLFQRLIEGNQKISGPDKNLSKRLEASIVLSGKTFPEAGDALFLTIDFKDINRDALQKWLGDSNAMRNQFYHFTKALESGWEVYFETFCEALNGNEQEGEQLFASVDYARIYAALASTADLLLTYVKREGLERSPLCPFLHCMKGEILRFLRSNEEMEDLAGLTKLLRQVLRANLPREWCFRLGDAEIPFIAESGVFYDNEMIYIPVHILRDWFTDDGITVPMPRILQAAQRDGYLKTYDLSKNTYEYKISVRFQDGSSKRLSRIALRRNLFEAAHEIPMIREAGEHIAF